MPGHIEGHALASDPLQVQFRDEDTRAVPERGDDVFTIRPDDRASAPKDEG